MPNKNFIGEDGFIHNVYEGDQSAQTLTQVEEELPKLTRKLRQDGKKVLVLSDISNLGRISLPGRIMGARIIKNLDYDKAAIFGPSHLERSVIEVIANVAGRGFSLKYFNDEKSAIDWLTENK